MAFIMVGKNSIALVDEEDLEELSKYRWSLVTQKTKNFVTYYAGRWVTKDSKHTIIRMHRQLLNAPSGISVDHINHNGLDNRRSNIRLCSCSQNNHNARKSKNRSCTMKGVYKHPDLKSRPYKAYVRINRELKHLGWFPTEIDAAKAYNKAAKENFGQFALLNSIPE